MLTKALLPSVAPGVVLGILVATGLLLPLLPVLAARLAWVLATNPITLR